LGVPHLPSLTMLTPWVYDKTEPKPWREPHDRAPTNCARSHYLFLFSVAVHRRRLAIPLEGRRRRHRRDSPPRFLRRVRGSMPPREVRPPTTSVDRKPVDVIGRHGQGLRGSSSTAGSMHKCPDLRINPRCTRCQRWQVKCIHAVATPSGPYPEGRRTSRCPAPAAGARKRAHGVPRWTCPRG